MPTPSNDDTVPHLDNVNVLINLHDELETGLLESALFFIPEGKVLAAENGWSPAKKERFAAIKGLEAVIDFIEAVYGPIGKDLSRPLVALHQSLLNVHRGRHDDLLTPDAKSNRPPDAAEKARLKAEAAVAMQYLVKGGASLEVASKKVAERVRQVDRDADGGFGLRPDFSWKTVKGWRDEILPPVSDPKNIAAGRAELLLSDENLPGASADAKADFILKNLLGSLRPPKSS